MERQDLMAHTKSCLDRRTFLKGLGVVAGSLIVESRLVSMATA